MSYTFVEYVERRNKIDTILESVAYEAESNPELMRLLEKNGFWSQLGGNLYQAGKKFIHGAWNQGGIATGAQAAWSQMTGPATQVGYAVAALEKALNAIKKDPNWQQSQTTGQEGKYASMPLVNWLADTIQELKNQSSQFANKELPSKDAAAPQTAPAQPAAGVKPGTAANKGV